MHTKKTSYIFGKNVWLCKLSFCIILEKVRTGGGIFLVTGEIPGENAGREYQNGLYRQYRAIFPEVAIPGGLSLDIYSVYALGI